MRCKESENIIRNRKKKGRQRKPKKNKINLKNHGGGKNIPRFLLFSFKCRRADKSPVVNPEPVDMTSPQVDRTKALRHHHYVNRLKRRRRYVYKNI